MSFNTGSLTETKKLSREECELEVNKGEGGEWRNRGGGRGEVEKEVWRGVGLGRSGEKGEKSRRLWRRVWRRRRVWVEKGGRE